jgi:uncharacterized YigZ family protein
MFQNIAYLLIFINISRKVTAMLRLSPHNRAYTGSHQIPGIASVATRFPYFSIIRLPRGYGRRHSSNSRKFSSLSSSHDGKPTIYSVTEALEYSEEIKKSKFIAFVSNADNIDMALAKLDSIKDPKATHNCWGFRSLDYSRSSDDGEPSGTAGKPILQAIESENLANCLVVVTRYYGGIKLGTGGLVRAYGSVAREALRRCTRSPIVQLSSIQVTVPLPAIGMLFQAVDIVSAKYPNVRRLREYYAGQGEQNYVVEISASSADHDLISDMINQICKGQAQVDKL